MNETAQDNSHLGISYYLKTGLLVVLLAISSFYLTREIVIYISIGEFFYPQFTSFIRIFMGMLMLLYTYSLTVGAWNKWEQFLIVPVPIAVGAFAEVYFINPMYAFTIALSLFLIISYDVMLATRIKKQLIAFNPRLILKLSTKGIIFAFSIVGALLLIANTKEGEDFNIAPKLGKIISTQVGNIIQPQLMGDTLQNEFFNFASETTVAQELNVDLNDPTIQEKLNQLMPKQEDTGVFENTITKEVNKYITPYKGFITPLMAIVVFGLIQFVGVIASVVFFLTVPLLFLLAKKTKFFNVKFQDVKQEIITFEK